MKREKNASVDRCVLSVYEKTAARLSEVAVFELL